MIYYSCLAADIHIGRIFFFLQRNRCRVTFILIVSDWMVHSCLWIVHEHSRAEVMCLSGSIYEDLDWGGRGGGGWDVYFQWGFGRVIYKGVRHCQSSIMDISIHPLNLSEHTMRRVLLETPLTDAQTHHRHMLAHTFKGFCHSSGAWAEPEQQELDWYFLLWHPWPASALIFHGGHACMYVCAWDWELVTLKNAIEFPNHVGRP